MKWSKDLIGGETAQVEDEDGHVSNGMYAREIRWRI